MRGLGWLSVTSYYIFSNGKLSFHFSLVSLFLVVQMIKNLKRNQDDGTSDYTFVISHG